MGVFVISSVQEERGEVYISGQVQKGVIRPGMEAVCDQHVVVVSRVYSDSDEDLEEATRGLTVKLLVEARGDWQWAQGLVGRQITFTSDKKETSSLVWQPEIIS